MKEICGECDWGTIAMFDEGKTGSIGARLLHSLQEPGMI